jgi:hypothetical protein
MVINEWQEKTYDVYLKLNAPLQENRTFVPSPVFDLYRVSLTLVQIIAFVPDGATARYKWPLTTTSRPPPTQPAQMRHICTGWWLRPIPVAATAWYKCEHICTARVLTPYKCAMAIIDYSLVLDIYCIVLNFVYKISRDIYRCLWELGWLFG